MPRLALAVVSGLMILLTALRVGVAQEPNVYFGNLHSHTSYSDGSGTPEEAYRHARDVGKLDFLAITEHNHAAAEDGAPAELRDGKLIGKDKKLYEGPGQASLIPAAQRLTEGGRFVALYGQEFSSIGKGNHVNVFDVPKVISDAEVKNGRFDSFVQWLERDENKDSAGAVAVLQLNHPALTRQRDPDRRVEYGRDDFASAEQWLERFGRHVALLELLNGPSQVKTGGHRAAEIAEEEYRFYLQQGLRVAPTADQDNHFRTWGTATDARTGVLAPALTKRDLLAALRARHVYATEDKNLKLVFKVNGRLCGDVLPLPQLNSSLNIQYRIEDANEPQARYRIDVFSGEVGQQPATVIDSVADQGNTPASQFKTLEDVQFSGGGQYVYFRITQTPADDDNEGGVGAGRVDRSWTAPVWFGSDGDDPDPDQPDIPVAKVVASKKSQVYHLSDECRGAKSIRPENLIRGEEAMQGRRPHQGCPQR